MNREIQLRLSPSHLAPARARGALMPLRGDLDAGSLESTALLVSELVTNAVRHGGLQSDQWIHLRVAASDSCIRVTVSDPGGGFIRRPPTPWVGRPTGWGLYLLGQLADRWGIIRDDDTRVWFEIDRQPTSNGHPG